MTKNAEAIAKHEQHVRDIYAELLEGYVGYPSTDAQFEFLSKQVGRLQYHIDMRNGLRTIDETSATTRA